MHGEDRTLDADFPLDPRPKQPCAPCDAATLFIYGSVGISHIPIRAFCRRNGIHNLAPTKRRPGFPAAHQRIVE